MAPPEGGDAPASVGASGMRVISCIVTEHDLRLVFLAAFVIPAPFIDEGPLNPGIGDELLSLGLDWLAFTPATLLPLILLAVGCWLVYWRRNIRAARVLLGVAVTSALLLMLLPMWLAPWKAVHAMQTTLARPPGTPSACSNTNSRSA